MAANEAKEERKVLVDIPLLPRLGSQTSHQ
jgi:hypothetical protein